MRPLEQPYEAEIKETYQGNLHYFLTHSSDSFNLLIANREVEGRQYQALVAKHGFKENDIIIEVRGSIIKSSTLQHLLEAGKMKKESLPLLVKLGSEDLLLSPKNTAKYVFEAPFIRQANCILEDTSSKLFIRAFQDISPGS